MPMGQMQKTVKINVTTSSDLWPYQVIDEIQKVMEHGERDGKSGWAAVDVRQHVLHAQAHIIDHIAGDTSEDHLAHAFTRLMMALAVERGYMDAPLNEFFNVSDGKGGIDA